MNIQKMRRKDREITDFEEIKKIIKLCDCCRIGLNDNGRVYIVPLNFGFDDKGEKLIFYFHGARAGRKIELIKKSDYAAFQLDTNHEVYTKIEGMACKYSSRFQSIFGEGKITIVEDEKEKLKGLILLMEHNTGKSEWNWDEKMVKAVMVFKLEIENISCKEHE